MRGQSLADLAMHINNAAYMIRDMMYAVNGYHIHGRVPIGLFQ